VAIGKGVYPDIEKLQELIAAKTKKLIAFDAVKLARESGNVLSVNMVLLGALIRTESIPLSADSVREVIRTKTKKAFVDNNLKAFELGYGAAA
jgi:indolepyruvate ferredoxin oxidoreductase beta subunit